VVQDEIILLTVKMAENQSKLFLYHTNGSNVDAEFEIERDPITDLNVGSSEGGGGNAHAAYGDCIFYRGSSIDREKVEGHLAHKWGIDNLLPSDHSYKNNSPNI